MKKKIKTWVILFIWLIIIFLFSNQANSSTISTSIISNVFKSMPKDVIKIVNYIIRKIAHISEYFILNIIVIKLLKNYINDNKKGLIISSIVTFIFTLLDEFHQSFIPGRSALFKDCLIDLIGIIIAVIFAILKYKNKKG